MSIRVLFADDQHIVRTGLTMLLDAQPDIDVVGAAADGREAVRLALQLRPDVGLFDIRMPLMDGIEATRRLAGPDVTDPLPIVVITTFDLDEYVHGALKAGARGFLLKDAGPALLTQAIHAAADGDALIAPSVTVRLLAAFGHAQASPPRQPVEPLTAREEEVLVPVAHGRTNNENASEPYITPSTVKAHLASLMCLRNGHRFSLIVRNDPGHAIPVKHGLHRRVSADKVVPSTSLMSRTERCHRDVGGGIPHGQPVVVFRRAVWQFLTFDGVDACELHELARVAFQFHRYVHGFWGCWLSRPTRGALAELAVPHTETQSGRRWLDPRSRVRDRFDPRRRIPLPTCRPVGRPATEAAR